MTREQRTALDQLLRASPLDLGGDLEVQRDVFEQMMSATPVADDVVTRPSTCGGVPVVSVEIRGVESRGVILYFHGGAYAIGSAALAAGLASDVARAVGARAVSVDYRLAPDHPYPAAIDDAVAAYRGLLDSGVRSTDIVLAGESAGGGVVVAALVALLRTDLPQPAAAYVVSPWVDLALAGESLTSKADADPALTPAGLARRARDYLDGHDPTDGAVSPVYADLAGLPPLLVQVGGNEVLLDDATRLATRAATDGVAVILDVTPDVPHVFVAFAAVLDEAAAALERAGAFLRYHLASGGWSAGRDERLHSSVNARSDERTGYPQRDSNPRCRLESAPKAFFRCLAMSVESRRMWS